MENNNEVNNLEKESLKNEQTNINKGKSNKKKLWLIITVIVVIAITGIIVYARISKDNCTVNTNNVNSNNKDTNSSIIYFNNKDTSSSIIYSIAPAKPIIYLYPQETTEVTVKLGNPEKITCSYPEYKKEWKVIADSDGILTDVKTQRKFYALYWEGKDMIQPEMTEGFIVKGQDTIGFLEEKLEILGLNEKETQEFIIYWLPKMQNNTYNYIRFATIEEINNYMPLELSVEPDTLIRVLMQYKPLDEYIEVKEQELATPERKGFTVVEWGGAEIK